MTDLYAVFGNPIAHSLSPQIHGEFARQTQQDLIYEKRLIPKDEFANYLEAFKKQGGKGLNVTVPFKEHAFQLCDQLSERAKQAQAVNTISITPQGLLGDNTDGIGLVQDLQNKNVPLKGQSILLLGAGGAARGVLLPLLATKPASVTLANRTLQRAQALQQHVQGLTSLPIDAVSLNHIPQRAFDIIINATSASLASSQVSQALQLPEDLIHPSSCCYDMVYGDSTPFLRWAKSANAQYIFDGLGMLIEQAAESFYQWRGVRPETGAVTEKIQASLRLV